MHTLCAPPQYVPGGSIQSLLRKYGRFPEGIVKFYTRQILTGLAYLHEVCPRGSKGAALAGRGKQ